MVKRRKGRKIAATAFTALTLGACALSNVAAGLPIRPINRPPITEETVATRVTPTDFIPLNPLPTAPTMPTEEPTETVKLTPTDWATEWPTDTPEATPTAEPTPEWIPPSLDSLVINNIELTEEDGIYILPEEVNPGDRFKITADGNDVTKRINILSRESVFWSKERPVHLYVTVPPDLGSVDIPIVLKDKAGKTAEYVLLIEPGSEFGPFADVELLSDIYADGQAAIELNLTDLNGDEIEIISMEQVLGLGDKYEGKEYVTSQELTELSIEDEILTVLANTPGNYRVKLVMTDGINETTQEVDIPVYWAPGENPWEIRGGTIATWGPPEWNDLDYVPRLIDIAHDMGMNYIQIAPHLYVESEHGSTIKFCNEVPNSPCTTPSDDEIREWIQHAHNLGMAVFLKPHLQGGDFDRERASYDFDSYEINPSNPTEWFASYTEFITHYAKIAQEEDVELFAVGNELTRTQGMTSRWREVIRGVREEYDGPLTYSDVLLWDRWSGQVWFWDDLDYLGIPYYFNGSYNDDAPTVSQMESHIQMLQKGNLSRATRNFENPMLATELGRGNFDGTNYHPWQWTDIVDNQEIVDYHEAAWRTQLAFGDRFEGGFLWKFETRSWNMDIEWDPRGKPLFDAIKFWYSN